MIRNGFVSRTLLLAAALILLPSPAQADCSPACRAALTAADTEIADLKSLHASDTALSTSLKAQRDKAYVELEKTTAPTPWYFWAAIGAAAGAAGTIYLMRR
jgi:hypothetical protein